MCAILPCPSKSHLLTGVGSILTGMLNIFVGGMGEDGGRVRRGDHLPSHRYSRNTSTHGTAPTEHPLNAGRKGPTSKKARNSPHTWVGQKKKEITETKE